MVAKSHGDFVFVGEARFSGSKIELPEDEKHHLFRVRRVRSGSEVYATDGRGRVHRVRVDEDQSLTIVETLQNHGEPTLNLHVLCGCLQGDSARDVVLSCVQLGVRKLTWVRLSRSQESYSESKLDKLRRVAIQSTKQSGRAWLLEQSQEQDLTEVIAGENVQKWVAHPGVSDNGLEPRIENAITQLLIVGPEGGFAEDELRRFDEAGCQYLSLGSNRLRTEWAVAAGIVRLRAIGRDF